jgi:mannitol/fructose-specific phosphotransferase system IIA component (Ntr-type)
VLLTPPREFQRELQILAAIVRLIMHANVRGGLLAARTEQALLNELGDADRASPSVPPSSLRTVSPRP